MRLQSFQPQFVHPYHFAFFHPYAHLSKIGYKQFDRFYNYTIHHRNQLILSMGLLDDRIESD